MIVKGLTVLLVSLAGLGALMTIQDLARGGLGKPRCAASDYNCNFESYLSDVSRMPADHSNAGAVAIDTPEAVWRNLAAVAELPDHQSIAMLHVLRAYPAEVRQRICRDTFAMERLHRRGEEIPTQGEYRDYRHLLAGLDCTLPSPGRRIETGPLID